MHKELFPILVVAALLSAPVAAQQVQVQEHLLDNGMRFLLVPRRGDPNVAAGWVARVGSVNERPGITGLSHLFEHMMFKGTHTIGTRDIKEDLQLIAELDEIKAQLAVEEQNMIDRLRLGEIDDLVNPENRTPRHQQLLEEFNRLLASQKELLVKGEFDRIYKRAGASSMNAGTSEDFTVYFINVPANKLELWFWMESDRLSNPVFREFYAERDVVREERRRSIESTPTGRFREEFNSLFWTSHPYSWPVVGWPSDLDGITRQEALDYFAVNYAPNNIVACLVGEFDPVEAKRLADKYFGRLQRSPLKQAPVRTREPEQMAEKRMVAYAETNPEVEIRYHTVADGHEDDAALTVAGTLLSGRTGRLYKSLVEDQQVANRASAGQDSRKWAGFFSISGIAKPGKAPEKVEQAIYAQLDRLREEPVGERELQKVKNRYAASAFRRMENNFSLMFQLLIAETNRGWEAFNTDPARLQAVTAEDIQRVVGKYFRPENRAVAIYYTKESEAGEAEMDPLLASLSPRERAAIQPMLANLKQAPAEQIEQQLAGMATAAGQVPEDQRKVFDVFRQLLERRLKELEEAQ